MLGDARNARPKCVSPKGLAGENIDRDERNACEGEGEVGMWAYDDPLRSYLRNGVLEIGHCSPTGHVGAAGTCGGDTGLSDCVFAIFVNICGVWVWV